MPFMRAPNCATGPLVGKGTLSLPYRSPGQRADEETDRSAGQHGGADDLRAVAAAARDLTGGTLGSIRVHQDCSACDDGGGTDDERGDRSVAARPVRTAPIDLTGRRGELR